LLIKLKDYERIYRVISSVMKSEGADPAHACTFFSVFGCHILQHHYNVEAIPRCGLAAFYVGGEREVLCFGDLTQRGLTANGSNFHCWIEVNGWVIDFMAPEFRKLFGTGFPIPAKMFQKRLSDMTPDINDLSADGDFFFHPSTDMAVKRLKKFWEVPVYGDLAEICTAWFKKYPKSIPRECGTTNGKGSYTKIRLSGTAVRSKW